MQDVTGRRSLQDRVRSSRRSGFLGRVEQRVAFAAALRGEPDAAQIFLVHGIGGIGKSALLRRLADDAHDAGWAVTWIDGEQVGASATAFEGQAEPVRAAERAALFVDGLEHCRSLETWLREQFLPTLPDDVLVVVAGRHRPQPHWTLDPGWRGLVREMQLGPLDRHEAAELLSKRGVAEDRCAAVLGFAGGHPLALCLAADVAGAAPQAGAAWDPGPLVVRTLLGQLIDRAPSAAHEYGLRVCCHVQHTTVDLLRTGLDEDTARVVFDWLSVMPCVTPDRHGLLLHDLVREVVDADVAWHSPEEHLRLRRRLWRHLGERVQAASDDALGPAVSELLYLARRGAGPTRERFGALPSEPCFTRAYTPELRAAVLRMAREDQGDEQARLVAYWLDRQPEAFHVHCRADDRQPVSVFAWLRLRDVVDAVGADPVLVPVSEHLERSAALGHAEYVGVARFIVPAPVAGHACVGGDVWAAHLAVAGTSRRNGLVASFVVLPDPESHTDTMAVFDFGLVGSKPDGAGRCWGVFEHDWRDVPMSRYLERVVSVLGPTADRGIASPRIHRLSRAEHDSAVRQALRDWHDDDAVAATALVGCCCDGASVRGVLGAAVDALGTDPSRVRHQRVIRAAHLERTTSQEATAVHLDIPFSTFRRYLKAGVDEVCEYLWRHHTDRSR